MTVPQDGLAALEHHGGCPHEATHIVEVHVVDFCDESWSNPFGNTTGILCDRCLAEIERDVVATVKRLNKFGRRACLTCGAPVVDVFDVLRDRKKL